MEIYLLRDPTFDMDRAANGRKRGSFLPGVPAKVISTRARKTCGWRLGCRRLRVVSVRVPGQQQLGEIIGAPMSETISRRKDWGAAFATPPEGFSGSALAALGFEVALALALRAL